MLDNLLQNAQRHGAAPVVVDVERDGTWGRLVVTDRGLGVPVELVGTLFDAFSQPEVGDRRSSQGLGLGLAICAQLAASNAGTIRYAPVEPSGASFEVRLPLAVRQHGTPAPAAEHHGSGPPAV